jgi:hypothetical protein
MHPSGGALSVPPGFRFHWWKKGLPFDTYVSNQIRSATNGFISPGSFSGSISPGSKGTFSPGFI